MKKYSILIILLFAFTALSPVQSQWDDECEDMFDELDDIFDDDYDLNGSDKVFYLDNEADELEFQETALYKGQNIPLKNTRHSPKVSKSEQKKNLKKLERLLVKEFDYNDFDPRNILGFHGTNSEVLGYLVRTGTTPTSSGDMKRMFYLAKDKDLKKAYTAAEHYAERNANSTASAIILVVDKRILDTPVSPEGKPFDMDIDDEMNEVVIDTETGDPKKSGLPIEFIRAIILMDDVKPSNVINEFKRKYGL